MAQGAGSTIFYRWLCKSYRNGTTFGFFVGRRVTSTAWFLMGLTVVSVLMGANIGQSVVVLFTSILCGMLGVGLVWAFFRRAKVSIVRDLPPTGAVGEEIRYSVSATNLGSGTLRDVRLREIGDDPRPTEWEFLHLKEPGEETRNIYDRVFAYYRWKWLTERGGKWKSVEGSRPLDLPPQKVVTTRLSLMPLRRGMLSIDDLRIELPDPFGLFQRSRKTQGESGEILVIPKRYRLPEFQLQGESELKVGGETASNVRGDGGEFLGLREYHRGDSLRRIDWKAWARAGEPIVKEYEEAHFPRYGLILDTSLKESGPEMFEEAVSVAASFVSTMDENRCLLDLMFVRNSPEVFTAGRGVARIDVLMEVLARVESSDEGGYDSLQRLVLSYAAAMTACVIVLTGWDQERKEFVQKLQQVGLSIQIYVVGVGEAPADAASVHWLRWNQVQKDLLVG